MNCAAEARTAALRRLSPICHVIVGICARATQGTARLELWARSVSGEAEKFDAGQTIFTKGQSGKHMYIVRSGAVDIHIDDRVVETVEANGIFGEMAVVDGSDRSGTARARTACELAPVDQRTFILMVDEAPYFALNVMRLMVHRLRRAGN